MAEQLNGASAFFKTVVEGGIDTMFATPGTSEMQVIDELGYSDLTAIMTLHENGVTAMADGYGRMKRRPALALVHVGAGLTNSLSSMHGARRAMTPMVVYSGHVAPYHEANNPVHIMKKRNPDLAEACADWVYEVKSPDEMGQAAARALEVANQAPGKIALVYAPNCYAWADASLMTAPDYQPYMKRRVASSTIGAIADAIKSGNSEGKKTAFIIGGSACMGEELEAAGRVAEGAGGTLFQEHFLSGRLQKGAGRVRTKGIPYEAEDAKELFSDYAQLVLIAGQIPAVEFSYKGKDLVKIAPDTRVLTLAAADCDILQALNELADAIGAPETCSDRYERAQVEAPTGPLTTMAIEQTATALLPENCIVVDDGVFESFMFRENTEGAEPYDLLPAPTGGQIGSGVPLGVGAAIACPDRKVVVMTGDYTLMQCNSALWNMAKQNVDVLVVCYDNGGSAALEFELGRVRRGDAQQKSLDMVHVREPAIDYATMAVSMGVPATQATTAEEFYEQFSEAMKNKGPRFLNAKVESNLPAMMKAVHGKDL